MPVLTKGSFSLDLGIVKLTGELSEQDRQCAWELYTELATRVALTGKQNDAKCSDFGGEILMESLASTYSFFQEARRIMKSFPVGKLGNAPQNHLGVLINNLMVDVLRPFLEKWQADFRFWWEHNANPKLPPFERQREFPHMKTFLKDWVDLRKILRALQGQLVQSYKLVEVRKAHD
jgi:hypothetical protein